MSTEFQVPIVWLLALPGVIFSVGLYLTRWMRRQRTAAKAQSWPAAQAVVNNSFELNESTRNVAPEGAVAEYVHIWAVAIQYAYQVNGEFYAGTYFLPNTYKDSGVATEMGRAWISRRITIRYDPRNYETSFFLESDGAPGKPHIPPRTDRPQVTTLSLK
ncbi:MAG TPA: hypothetical protein VI685_11215 [Candidatus Angelobacter sp.]